MYTKKTKVKEMLKRVNDKILLSSADLGKKFIHGYFLCPDGSDVNVFKFHNNGRGFTYFYSRMKKLMKQKGLDDVVIAVESTGPYGYPFIHYLQKRKVHVVQVNPKHTKKMKEIEDNSPGKTDHKDPKVIMTLLKNYKFLSVIIPEGSAAELRNLTLARERAKRRSTIMWNQLYKLLFPYFPELFHIMRNIKTKTVRYILENYPTPDLLSSCNLEDLVSILHKISRGRIRKECIEALYKAACNSVGILTGKDTVIDEVTYLLSCISDSESYISILEQNMSYHLSKIPYSGYILSVKGIGIVTAAGLIGEVGDFRQYSSASELLRLAGLNLFEVSSGDHKGQCHISKRGRSLLRKILFYAAINTVRKGGIFHDLYQSYVDRGMKKLKALTAICRKLLVVLFALVRDNSEYILNYNKNILKEAA